MLVKKEIKDILSFFICVCITIVFSSCGASVGTMHDSGAYEQENGSVSEREDKEVLIIATLEADSLLEDAVREFNKEHDDIRLVIKQYVDFEDENADYEYSEEKFLEEIALGEGFDLVNIPRSLVLGDVRTLEDLQPYIDDDRELSEAEFNQSVLNGFRSNGKLLGIPAFFSISGLTGDVKTVGEGNLNAETVLSLLMENPESGIYRNCTPSRLVENFLTYSGDYFYNKENGTYNFSDGKMGQIIEAAYMLDLRKNSENYNEAVTEAYGNEFLFESFNITEPMDFMLYFGRYGADTVFLGYPSVNGCAPEAVVSCTVIGMNRECENKTAAFEFIKSVYKRELLGADRWGLPTDNRELMEVIEENLQGNFRGETNVYIWDDMSLVLDGLTEENADALYELANNAVVVRNGNTVDEIYKLVMNVFPEVLSNEIAIDDACEILQGIKESGP